MIKTVEHSTEKVEDKGTNRTRRWPKWAIQRESEYVYSDKKHVGCSWGVQPYRILVSLLLKGLEVESQLQN